MRPPRGPAGRDHPSPCPGRLRPRGRGEAAGDARTRVPATVPVGTRDAGVSGAVKAERAPGLGQREGWVLGWQERVQGAFWAFFRALLN